MKMQTVLLDGVMVKMPASFVAWLKKLQDEREKEQMEFWKKVAESLGDIDWTGR